MSNNIYPDVKRGDSSGYVDNNNIETNDTNNKNDTKTIVTTNSNTTNVPQMSHGTIMLIFSALMLSMGISSFDATIIGVVTPNIVETFNDFANFNWVMSGYMGTMASLTPMYGRLSDIYGRKYMMLSAISFFAAGSIVAALAPTMIALIIGRAIQGVGAAGLGSLVMTIMSDILPPIERGKYMGFLAMMYGIASVLGPIVGGIIVEHTTWRWVFWINLPICAIAAIPVALYVPHMRKERKVNIDWLGSLLVTGGTILLVLALTWGGTTYAWSDKHVVAPLIVSIIMFIAFATFESWYDPDHAILPMKMFLNRNYSVSSIHMILYGSLLFSLLGYLPNFFQLVWGSSSIASGAQVLPMMGGLVLMAIVSGQVISHTGKYRILTVIGAALCLLASVLFRNYIQVSKNYATLGVLMAILGAGTGMVAPVATILTTTSVPKEFIAVATTGAAFVRSLGGAVGTTIVATVLNNTYKNRLNVLPAPLNNELFNANHQIVSTLPTSYQNIVYQGYVDGMKGVFAVVIAMSGLMLLFAPVLKHEELKHMDGDNGVHLEEMMV